MAKKEIYLVFTRSFSLFITEYWRTPLLIPIVNNSIGYALTDQIAHFDGKTQYYYRSQEEMDKLKEFALQKTPSDSLYSKSTNSEFRQKTAKIKKIFSSKKEISELKGAYLDAKRLFEEIYPGYILGVFFAGAWADEYRKRHGIAAEKILKMQLENRITSEGLLGELGIFVSGICRILLRNEAIDPELMCFDEVENLILKNQEPDAGKVRARGSGFIHIGGNIILGNELESVLSKNGYFLLKEKLGKLDSFKGVTAFASKPIEGKVRLVRNFTEMERFRANEIMVCPMTQPSFLPAMKKAKAVITDEGGITCHAAIVAREFKIPTIIGTKIASKVLKNGELIRVDAQKGIVELLK